jgi:hypothetical protein
MLVEDLEEAVPAEGANKVILTLDQSGWFSVNSMYKLLCHEPQLPLAVPIWKTTFPVEKKSSPSS